jgi:hypothetical protein
MGEQTVGRDETSEKGWNRCDLLGFGWIYREMRHLEIFPRRDLFTSDSIDAKRLKRVGEKGQVFS